MSPKTIASVGQTAWQAVTDLAVANRPAVLLSLDPGRSDPLRAVGALFHHTTAANCDLRVTHQLVLRRVPILVKQEVKPANLVRAVVRTVTRADAAVVDHVVKTLRHCEPSHARDTQPRTVPARTADKAAAGNEGLPAH